MRPATNGPVPRMMQCAIACVATFSTTMRVPGGSVMWAHQSPSVYGALGANQLATPMATKTSACTRYLERMLRSVPLRTL